ncbi:hypothetical protein D1J51_10685 [Leucobacter sp. wl10]|nr:hypothetical protein D1J51_10685 [Leucobacter sp. wl10]
MLVETVAWIMVAAILGAEITALALILATTSIERDLYVGLLGIVNAGSAAALLGAASATLFVQAKHLFKFFKQRT